MNADKERILMTIIRGMDTHRVLGKEYGVYTTYETPKKGDLVICQTSGPHPWMVGYMLTDRDPQRGAAMIREIGSQRACDVSNESFHVLRGLSVIDLLEGQERQFYVKVLKAFDRADEWYYRFGGIVFNGKEATITIRARYNGLPNPVEPFDVVMPWNKKTTIKAIVEALKAGGLGTRQFEPVKEQGEPKE